jgi:hypothetical protein
VWESCRRLATTVKGGDKAGRNCKKDDGATVRGLVSSISTTPFSSYENAPMVSPSWCFVRPGRTVLRTNMDQEYMVYNGCL